jgi:hypothetical protein
MTGKKHVYFEMHSLECLKESRVYHLLMTVV